MWIHYTHTGAGPALSASVPQSVFTITEKAPRGPSRGLLRDCTTSLINRLHSTCGYTTVISHRGWS